MRWLAVAIVLAASPALADPVPVKVTEIAGGSVYLAPGRAAGIVRGTKIKLHGVELVVVEVTEKTCVAKVDGRIAIGDSGIADVTPGAAAAVTKLAPPHPPEAFAGQWRDPVLPASQQNPAEVPLGGARTTGGTHVTVIAHGYGTADRHAQEGDGEARVIASFDLMEDRPLAADVDVAGRVFSTGYDKLTHTPLFVRAAQLRYGDAADPALALGRLRYAATSVGMLDGGRAAAHVGAIEVAAFGGVVPDPLSGKPDTSATRFGGEFIYDGAAEAWQPRIAVAAHGSTWDGKLDERRLSVAASAKHDALWLDAWGEAQMFDSDNPWGASTVELVGAGATVEWRKHGRYAGVDLDFLRPERSLRLAAALPPEWLCTLAPQPGNVPETCSSGDWWGAATASAGMRTARYSIDAVGTLGNSHGVYRGLDSSGYLRGELYAGFVRFEAGVSAGKASFAGWTSGEVGVGYAVPALDVLLRYRPELLDYAGSTGPIVLHSVSVDGRYAMTAALDAVISAIGTTGADRDAVALLASLIWRPLP